MLKPPWSSSKMCRGAAFPRSRVAALPVPPRRLASRPAETRWPPSALTHQPPVRTYSSPGAPFGEGKLRYPCASPAHQAWGTRGAGQRWHRAPRALARQLAAQVTLCESVQVTGLSVLKPALSTDIARGGLQALLLPCKKHTLASRC